MTSAPTKPWHRRLPGWLELIVIVLLAVAVAALTKAFLVQSFFVPSGSMKPLLHGNEATDKDDRIVVEKVSYWNGDIHRGDVVVFDDSLHWLPASAVEAASGPVQQALEKVGMWPTGGHLVKRVIGLPGDTVACCDDEGRMTVNDVPLDEDDYLAQPGQPASTPFAVTVPDDSLWMMGDNRGNSDDSRAHAHDKSGGFVPVDDVVGKVLAIVWPLDRAGLLDRPDTFDNEALDGG